MKKFYFKHFVYICLMVSTKKNNRITGAAKKRRITDSKGITITKKDIDSKTTDALNLAHAQMNIDAISSGNPKLSKVDAAVELIKLGLKYWNYEKTLHASETAERG